jgi:preprotein translocase subunit SecG
MSPFTIVLYIVVVIVALLLIGLILIQQSKGGGFGTAFGGAGEAVFGARAAGHLTKLTVILTAVFFLLTLALVVITGTAEKSSSINLVDKNLSRTTSATEAGSIKADVQKTVENK